MDQYKKLTEEQRWKHATVLSNATEFRRTYFPEIGDTQNFEELMKEGTNVLRNNECDDKTVDEVMTKAREEVEEALQSMDQWKMKLILTDMQMDERVPSFVLPFVSVASQVMSKNLEEFKCLENS